MRTSTTTRWLLSILLLWSLSASLALAEEVTFRANVLNSNTIHQGDTFQVQVFLDITAGKSIKQAEFQLTPSANAGLTSASSANMFIGATQLYGASGAVIANGVKYGESTAADQNQALVGDQGIEGNNQLFATVSGTATTAGAVTLTFSNLVAKKGTFSRTVISSPVTFTVLPAEICTARPATCDEAGVACPGSIPIDATGCPPGQTCTNHQCVEACTPQAATACVPGVGCPGNIVLPAPGCPQGQACDAQNNCVAVTLTKKQQVRQQVDALIDAADIPEDRSTPERRNAFLTFVSNLANTLKNLFR